MSRPPANPRHTGGYHYHYPAPLAPPVPPPHYACVAPVNPNSGLQTPSAPHPKEQEVKQEGEAEGRMVQRRRVGRPPVVHEWLLVGNCLLTRVRHVSTYVDRRGGLVTVLFDLARHTDV